MKSTLTPHFSRPSVWDFMSEFEKVFDDAWTQPLSSRGQLLAPKVDVKETSDYYLFSVDLPGVQKNDIKVDFHDGRLTIIGERRQEKVEDKDKWHRVEREYGRFERSFQMPPGVAEDKIQARQENGVLEILVPKLELKKPKSISIEGEGKGLFSRLLGSKEEASTKQ